MSASGVDCEKFPRVRTVADENTAHAVSERAFAEDSRSSGERPPAPAPRVPRHHPPVPPGTLRPLATYADLFSSIKAKGLLVGPSFVTPKISQNYTWQPPPSQKERFASFNALLPSRVTPSPGSLPSGTKAGPRYISGVPMDQKVSLKRISIDSNKSMRTSLRTQIFTTPINRPI
jgi:hypothetical protein